MLKTQHPCPLEYRNRRAEVVVGDGNRQSEKVGKRGESPLCRPIDGRGQDRTASM